ncbi:MAG: hypothetical protein JSS61_06205 [Verrucomicrobia bacterium]|nr:hypothetical protein [Verrucomicrobiota bacterium]
MPLVIVNNTGLPSSSLYFIGKGNALDDSSVSFLQPNTITGVCTLASSATNNSADPTISLPLSSLPQIGMSGNVSYLFIPQFISGRCFISVNDPLLMKTSYTVTPTGTVYTADDPSTTSTQDPNYYTLYQNFEFTLDDTYTLFTNFSNVDYFSLPTTLGSYTFPTGNSYPTPVVGLTNVGYPSTLARSAILSGIQTTLSNLDASVPTKQWPNLSIPFYVNPYTGGSPLTYLRILAAKGSIGLQSGYKFSGANPAQAFFNSNYLQDTVSGPTAGKSYMQELLTYYSTNQMQILLAYAPPMVPQVQATYLMRTDIGNLELTLLSTTPPGDPSPPSKMTVFVPKLTTELLLSGGGWISAGALTASGGTQATGFMDELSKGLSTLFTAGFLPPPNTLTQPIQIQEGYFTPYRSQYFNNPASFSAHGPWYNLYDKAIHPLLIQTSGFGLGYAYDYDDLLDLAGVLIFNVNTDPNQPYIILTLGPIDTSIPDPQANIPNSYTLNIGALGFNSNPIDIVYSTTCIGPPATTIAVTNAPQTVNNVCGYFLVKYYTTPAMTSFLSYRVYPQYQLVLPESNYPRYNAQDVTLMNGILFQSPTDGSTFSVVLPNTNPFPAPSTPP